MQQNFKLILKKKKKGPFSGSICASQLKLVRVEAKILYISMQYVSKNSCLLYKRALNVIGLRHKLISWAY